MTTIPNGIRQSNDAKLKLTVIKCCNTAREFSCVEVKCMKVERTEAELDVHESVHGDTTMEITNKMHYID
jgi:hypothetical protein